MQILNWLPKTHPLIFSPPSLTLKVIFSNRALKWESLPTLLLCLGAGFIFTPIRLLDSLLFKKRLSEVKLDPSPIFILGHWRSGTTFLQTLLAQDQNLGYLCGYQAFVPGIELINIKPIYWLLDRLMPKKRLMDNMPRGMRVPEEEEFSLTALEPIGSYHSLWFPKNESYFKKYTLFQSCSLDEIETWKLNYIKLLKRISLFTSKSRLVLKNPPNTARIKVLLELFPNAKFVNIYRNPYDVFFSMKNMYTKSIAPFFLQNMSESEINEKILNYFELVMKQYFSDVQHIPKDNFIDIKYEDLSHAPLEFCEKIYKQFRLDFNSAKPQLEKYLQTVESYEKNSFKTRDPKLISLITKRLQFILEKYNYKIEE